MEKIVNLDRVRGRIQALSRIGARAGGGITRQSYTDEDRQAKDLFANWCRECGLGVRYDPVGNLIASNGGTSPIALGSHLDTVPAGGRFDGVLGCIGALECAELLAGKPGSGHRGLEIIVFADEEGSRFGAGLLGSRAMIGTLERGELERVRDRQGLNAWDAMSRAGFEPEKLADAKRQPDSLQAYLELHIEQGGILEKRGLPIGVVSAIVGISRRELKFRGSANHAGTTPFELRRDALMAAARFVSVSRELTRKAGGPASVSTIGRIEARPGAINVVPGEVDCSLEIRDVDEAKMRAIGEALLAECGRIAGEERVGLEIVEGGLIPPVAMDERIRAAVRSSCAGLGYDYLDLPSGAGHDAQSMAHICPTGMIFVPSVGGISHSPLEDTRWEDVERGVRVLFETVKSMGGYSA